MFLVKIYMSQKMGISQLPPIQHTYEEASLRAPEHERDIRGQYALSGSCQDVCSLHPESSEGKCVYLNTVESIIYLNRKQKHTCR